MKISNIAELKTRKGASNANVEVLGYYTSGDGGGGSFYWDNASTETDNGGTIIQVTSVTTGRWKRVISQKISIKQFGAKGDNTNDDTVFIQNCINSRLTIGGEIFFESGTYKVTDTITIGDTQGITIRGHSPQGCIINFVNSVSNKELFFFSPSSSYCSVEDICFIDVNAGTSIAIKTQDQLNIADPRPNWKMSFHRVRVANFLTGYIATTSTPLNGANHAFLDGVSFYHCKFRNCRTAYMNQNIQAVNINFFNTDIENDDPSEQYTMIRDEAGFTLNVFGGSWIGKGKIYDGYYNPSGTTLFTNGNINWDGTRFEIRNTSVGNIVTIPKKASSVFLNLTFNKCAFGLNSQDVNFCDYTGKVNININDCLVQSGTLILNQYATSGLSGADATGGTASYGGVYISKSNGFRYVRNEGSAYGTFQRSHTAKVSISNTAQGTSNQFSIDSQGFIKNTNDELTQRGGGLGYSQYNTMIYNVENYFLGFSALKLRMPYYATPASLIVYKSPRIFNEANIVKLYLVKDVASWVNPLSFNVLTDAFLIATTPNLFQKCGITEIPITIDFDYLVTGLDFKSGFGNWLEGRVYVEHSGSASFSGFVGIKYM